MNWKFGISRGKLVCIECHTRFSFIKSLVYLLRDRLSILSYTEGAQSTVPMNTASYPLEHCKLFFMLDPCYQTKLSIRKRQRKSRG